MMWNFLIWLQAEQRSWDVCLQCRWQIRAASTQCWGWSGVYLLILLCLLFAAIKPSPKEFHRDALCRLPFNRDTFPFCTTYTGHMKVKLAQIELNTFHQCKWKEKCKMVANKVTSLLHFRFCSLLSPHSLTLNRRTSWSSLCCSSKLSESLGCRICQALLGRLPIIHSNIDVMM